MFFYTAGCLSCPYHRSKRIILEPWQTCSFGHQLDFSGKHSSHAAITHQNYSLILPPLSIARYSFIQLSELVLVERTKMPTLRNGSNGGFETGASWLRLRHSTVVLQRPTRRGWFEEDRCWGGLAVSLGTPITQEWQKSTRGYYAKIEDCGGGSYARRRNRTQPESWNMRER